MSTYYFNLKSNEDCYSQWEKYKQNSSYIKDIVKSNSALQDVMHEQLESLHEIITKTNGEQLQAIQDSTDAVCGTLDEGFSLIDSQLKYMNLSLSEIESELSNISSMLSWNFSIFIAEQKISNILMGNIAQLLRIPDSQKERQYALEQGLKFIKNAAFDEDFYEDALTNLDKAEKIEPTDYFVLHHIGLIYLNSIKHLDISKAESYFKKAAKYAYAETNNNAARTNDILKLNPSQFFDSKDYVSKIKLQTAESYMYLGRCKYIQGNMLDAIENAGKAYSLVPDLLDAGYLKAKAYASIGKMCDSLEVLNTIVDKNRFYMSKILCDQDFLGKKETAEFIKSKRDFVVEYAKKELNAYKLEIRPYSHSKEIVLEVEKLLNQNNYFAAMKALDLIGLSFNQDAKNTISKIVCIENYALEKMFKPIKEKYDDSLRQLLYKIEYNNKQLSEKKEMIRNLNLNLSKSKITSIKNVFEIAIKIIFVIASIVFWIKAWGTDFLGIVFAIIFILITWGVSIFIAELFGYDDLFHLSSSPGFYDVKNNINLYLEDCRKLTDDVNMLTNKLDYLQSNPPTIDSVLKEMDLREFFDKAHSQYSDNNK